MTLLFQHLTSSFITDFYKKWNTKMKNFFKKLIPGTCTKVHYQLNFVRKFWKKEKDCGVINVNVFLAVPILNGKLCLFSNFLPSITKSILECVCTTIWTDASNTNERLKKSCGQMGVMHQVFVSGCKTGPCAERLYAVDPVEVAKIIPSERVCETKVLFGKYIFKSTRRNILDFMTISFKA